MPRVALPLSLAALLSTAACTTPGRTAGATFPWQPLQPTDETIVHDVKLRLATSPWLSGPQVSVDSDDGRVTLFGAVPSKPSADRAVYLARSVQGVTAVRERLVVVPPSAAARLMGDDAELEASLRERLRQDPRLQGVEIAVAGGAVRLSGTVSDAAARREAAQIAGGTRGVRRVFQDVELAGASPGA